jgi:hypothetical protein
MMISRLVTIVRVFISWGLVSKGAFEETKVPHDQVRPSKTKQDLARPSKVGAETGDSPIPDLSASGFETLGLDV